MLDNCCFAIARVRLFVVSSVCACECVCVRQLYQRTGVWSLCVACRVSTHEVRQLDLFQQSEEERNVQSAAQWMRGALCVVYISTNDMQQLALFKWLHDASATMQCWIILAWS